MTSPKKQDFNENGKIGDSDRVDRSNSEGSHDSSSFGVVSVDSDASGVRSGENGGSRDEIGVTERSTDILVDGDGDLLLQQEDRVIQWLQALDLQVMGACRADERLKPLLKLNVSSGMAEERLLTHLNQHFEASEVGMLARCLCIPLVSIRVGKIMKQGTLLCPTATRGSLNLTLLPTSDLRISFVGDDGCTERLSTLSNGQCSAVAIEGILAESSGRSFLIKVPGGEVFYFWCSEKSKLLGIELLSKMKDILERKPSLSELTGISEARLDCFATHLRAYLVGSTVKNPQASSTTAETISLDITLEHSESTRNAHLLSVSSKSLRSRHNGTQAVKANSPYQGSLSPRSSSFKEGLPRSLSSLRSAAREKLRRRGDGHLSATDNEPVFTSITVAATSSLESGKDKPAGVTGTGPLSTSFLESLRASAVSIAMSPVPPHPPPGSSFFSPYYCWCPPIASTLQYTVAPPQHSISPEPSLPPLSSLLPATGPSSMLTSMPTLDLSKIPSVVDFPAFLPEPLVRLPFTTHSAQQIPTFTPLMCDPIVHVPVIDVCSAGQGYLVSAGPSISTSMPPLHPKIVNPLIPEAESVVEKGARETLRLLISGSNQSSPQLMDVLPAVLTNSDEKQSVLVTGSRGLYNGTRDVGALASSIAAMGLASLSVRSVAAGSVVKRCSGHEDRENQTEGSGGTGGPSADEERRD
ncbi:uncharacterized protein LOC131167012 [Malania oleifera]|uniref:uncharacterized protein LOC131167012 n=1 Tax=Malania oleifera TaxID=397392 RepID=UPI0025ADDBF5|nr:uncharacterized protein LOC131167012 [Malania oleifera]